MARSTRAKAAHLESDDEPGNQNSDPDDRAMRLMRSLLLQGKRARSDMVEFFAFAMKAEATQQALDCVPLQRALFSFVLHHPQCVVRMPISSSKTYCMAALGLWLLGNDVTQRGAIISAAQEQAIKPLGMIQDYIEHDGGSYPELALVFPELKPSHRRKDAWQQNKIVVDRPAGIRDPSLAAIGFGGKLPGARLSWILVDDILTEENTSTPASRLKINRWFMSTVLARKDVSNARVVVTNTPWNPGTSGADAGDLTYKLEGAGWPTFTVDIEGDITITNADPEWDCEDIRPSFEGRHPTTNTHRALLPTELPTEVYRLAAHDSAAFDAPPCVRDKGVRRRATAAEIEDAEARGVELERYDIDEEIPVWPERFPIETINRLRVEFREQYPQLYRCRTRDDESAACQLKWFERGKKLANACGFTTTVASHRSNNLVGTGIDLGIGTDERKHDWTVLFTFELIPSIEIEGRTYRNMRRILNVRYIRAEGRALVDLVIGTARAYGGILKVETNAAQDYLRQWTLDVDISVPIISHTTGVNKHHRTLGVRGLFVELENGAWLIPSDSAGNVAPDVQRWINECLDWRPPPAHTADGLIASWIARTLAHSYDRGGRDAGRVADEIAQAVGTR